MWASGSGGPSAGGWSLSLLPLCYLSPSQPRKPHASSLHCVECSEKEEMNPQRKEVWVSGYG